MAGSKEGAQRAAQTMREKYGDTFFARIGMESWKNERSRATGFALMPKEKHLVISSKGGKAKKNRQSTLKTEIFGEEVNLTTEAHQASPSEG